MEEQARERLREEVRALRGHPLTASGDREDVLEPRLAEQVRDVCSSGVDRGDRFVRAWRVPDALEAVAIDELDVELAFGAAHELDAAAPVGDRERAVWGLALEQRERLLHACHLLAFAEVAQVGSPFEDPVRRERVQPRIGGGDQERHHTCLVRLSGTEGKRRLVAVVPVGDEELRVADRGRQRPAPPPEANTVDLDVGRSLRARIVERAVDEEEERLGMHPRLPQELQPLVLRPLVRTLVRQDHSGRVRLGGERSDDSAPFARDAIRPRVLLDERPGRRLVLPLEQAFVEPAPVEPSRVLG